VIPDLTYEEFRLSTILTTIHPMPAFTSMAMTIHKERLRILNEWLKKISDKLNVDARIEFNPR